MKFVLTLILLVLTSALQAQNTAVQPIDGTDCSNLFFKALADKDVASLVNLMTSDFTVVSFDGQRIDGQRLQQAVSEGYIIINSGMLSGASTRTYGDVAIVTGQWNISARIADNNFQGQLAYLSVCVRAGGKWKVATVQLTPLR